MKHALDRIVVMPVNGYINRLQAWASAAILGEELGVPVSVLWLPEAGVAPADPQSLFSADLLSSIFIESEHAPHGAPTTINAVQPGLHADVLSGVVTLAGRERGEQHYVDDLMSLLSEDGRLRTLVIAAGGLFWIGNEVDFNARRRAFYRSLDWHPDITTEVARQIGDRKRFLALHSRRTDRSGEVATDRSLHDALRGLALSSRISSLFIAADSPEGRTHWRQVARSEGLDAWDNGAAPLDRTVAEAGRGALIDWLVMTKSAGVIYSTASTFGREAVVAGNLEGSSIGLEPSAKVRRARILRTWLIAAMTYPRRHWFPKASNSVTPE